MVGLQGSLKTAHRLPQVGKTCRQSLGTLVCIFSPAPRLEAARGSLKIACQFLQAAFKDPLSPFRLCSRVSSGNKQRGEALPDEAQEYGKVGLNLKSPTTDQDASPLQNLGKG